MPEVLNKRTYASKTIDNGDGTFTLEAHAGHIHYKDAAGDFVDVDFTVEDMGTYWRMTKASYRLFVAKGFGDPQLIRFDNRYEGANHTIYYEPHSLWWVNAADKSQRTKLADAQAVTGALNNGVIRYTDAFGPGIHFEVTVQRSGFKKEVVIDSQASLGASPYADYLLVPVFKWTGSGLKVRATGLADWDEAGYYEHGARFEIREVATGLKSYIAHASGTDATGRTKALKVFFEKRGGILWQGKLITRAMVENAAYPVRADTVTNYDPTAGDGYVHVFDRTTWDNAHDAASGDAADYTGTLAYSGSIGESSSVWSIARAFFPIDTSGLPDTAVISAAVLYLYASDVVDDDNDAQAYITIVDTSQASTSSLVNADFDNCGDAVDNPTEGIDSGQRADITGVSTSAYTTFTLNATGRGWISKTGVTKLGAREGHDTEDVPVGSSFQFSRVGWYASEQTGTANDPYLEVTYTNPVTVSPGNDTLSYAGQTPSAIIDNIIKPGQDTLSYAGQTPTVDITDHKTVAPGQDSLAYTGQVPVVNITDHKTVAPGQDTLSYAGQTPVVNVTDHKTVAPGQDTLSYTGQVPTIIAGADVTVVPGAGSLSYSGLAASLVLGIGIGAASLSFTGQAPVISVSADRTIQVPSGSVTMAGQAPTIVATANVTIDIGNGTLTLTGQAPTVIAAVAIAPEVLSQKVLVVTAVRSSVNATGTVKDTVQVVTKITDKVEGT